MSIITDIAAAVVAGLNAAPAGTFSMGFTAARAYKPVYDLAEMKALHVTVVPKSSVTEAASRSSLQHDVAVDIGVQKKIAADTEIDALMALVEQIADFFRLRRLAAMPSVIWVRTENTPIYSPEHLEQMRQFTSVLTLTFRVIR